MMQKKHSHNKKILIISLIVLGVLLLFLSLFLGLYFSYFNHHENNLDLINASLKADQIVDDPTKITPSNWANLVIVIGIFVIIGLLGIGIIGFTIYIIVYYHRRAKAKFPVVINEDNVNLDYSDDTGMNDYIKVTISEKGEINEEK